jgi:hypothetical protein
MFIDDPSGRSLDVGNSLENGRRLRIGKPSLRSVINLPGEESEISSQVLRKRRAEMAPY